MNRMKRKLKNQSGASMVLALLFFFFCLTVGAVVLTSASANAGRTLRLRTEQQQRLAADSAARLVRDSLSALTFTGGYTEHRWEDDVEQTGIGSDGKEYTYYVTIPGGPDYTLDDAKTQTAGEEAWKQQLSATLKSLYTSTTPLRTAAYAPAEQRLTLESGAIDGMQVVVRLTLKEDYSIGVSLYRTDSAPADTPVEDNAMSFTLSPTITPGTTYATASDQHTRDWYTYYTTGVTWTAGDIVKGEKA